MAYQPTVSTFQAKHFLTKETLREWTPFLRLLHVLSEIGKV